MKARQSVTHPLPFPMEARRRGGPQEANLVEWPLKQQSAVNMLWCHAPNRYRADCPRLRERTLAPGRHFMRCCRGTAADSPCAECGCKSNQESLSGDLSSDGQLLDIDSAQRLTINWPCGNAGLHHGPRSCFLWLPEEEEEEERLSFLLRSDQRKCARIVMMLFGQTWGSHRRPGCSVWSVQVHQVLTGPNKPTWDSPFIISLHLRLFCPQSVYANTGNMSADITGSQCNWWCCAMISGDYLSCVMVLFHRQRALPCNLSMDGS